MYDVVGITGNDPFNFSMNEKIINKTKALDKEHIKKITTVRNKSFVIYCQFTLSDDDLMTMMRKQLFYDIVFLARLNTLAHVLCIKHLS